jgi:hypothetical protein
LVQEHLTNKKKLGTFSAEYDILKTQKTLDWKNYLKTQDVYWRIYDFAYWTITQDEIQNLEQAEEVWKIVSQFHLNLFDLDEKLFNPLSWFHHTPTYFVALDEAIKTTKNKRNKQIEDWLESEKQSVWSYFDLIETWKIPTRINHNDPKINNILFNKDTAKPSILIDWDTISDVLPVLVDIWDMCRSLCITHTDDIKDVDNQKFREDVFESLMKWYLLDWKDYLLDIEKEHIVFSVGIIILELAMRYYTDYLLWNLYFSKIKYPTQNLDKANRLFYLWKDFDSKREILENIVKKYL